MIRTFFFILFLWPVLAVAAGPKNAHCRLVLEREGMDSVQKWLIAKISELEKVGVDVSQIPQLADVSRNHLVRLLEGKTTNLGTDLTKRFDKLFTQFLTPTTSEDAAVNQSLHQFLEPFENQVDAKSRRRAIYTHHPSAVPVPSEIAEKTKTSPEAARYYLKDVASRRMGTGLAALFRPDIVEGKWGERTFWTTTQENDPWFQTDFMHNPAPGDAVTKVYVSLPQDKAFETILPVLTDLADVSRAGALKFAGTSTSNRADRVVVYFNSPQDAFSFAKKAVATLDERGIKGEPLSMAYQVGNSPVSIAMDRGEQSWRRLVSGALAEAYERYKDRPNRDDLIRRELLHQNIDPATWLPGDFAKAHRDELAALRSP